MTGVQTCALPISLREVVKYPLSIFPVFVKNFFTFLIPFGFVGYYPACYFLGKIDKNFQILLIFIALITATLARYIWKVGIKNYESVGN